MSPKRKTPSSKENWQAKRAPYTWYFRPPFDKEFDCAHWWKLPNSKISQVAALYELARRHPLVGKGLFKRMPNPAARAAIYAKVWGYDPICPPALVESRLHELIREVVIKLHEPPSIYWTCLVGLKSWAQLNYAERKNWESNIGNLKGLDLRDEDLQCYSINQMAHWRIIDERKAALRKKGQINDLNYEQTHEKWEADRKKNLRVLHNDLAVNPPTTEEWEAAIGSRAVEAYRQGNTLLAVAPNLKADKAASIMKKVYDLTERRKASPKQKARWQDWLPLISQFEEAVTKRQKDTSQVFIRYRRAIDGICFT